MTDSPQPRRARWIAAAIVLVLVVVVAVVIAIGVGAAGGPGGSPTSSASMPAGTGPTPTAVPTTSSTPSVSPTGKPKPSATAPSPQPTKTATISSPAPIARELTAKVTKTEAVQGKAQGPGEVAGPAVRFTITITNSTGKKVDLTHTVVNAFYGKASTPATELGSPGGKPFPSTVAEGRIATGVFVFNIPKDQRNRIEVTVDTSVKNPVVAFRGSAPK